MVKATANCSTCPNFVPPLPLPTSEAVRASIEKSGTTRYELGKCRFMPTEVSKRPDEWCGQHPERRK